MNFKNLFKNFSYSILVNLLIMLTTFIVTIFAPKILGITEYSYWQLYVFYLSYVGFLHFGLADGVYLKYGGLQYDQLNKSLIGSQFWFLLGSQMFIGLIFGVLLFIFNLSLEKTYLFLMIILYFILINPRYLLLFTLQTTNRIKDYAKIMIVDRVIFIMLIIIMFIFKIDKFEIMIFIDLIARIISTIYCLWICKNIVFSKLYNIKLTVIEVLENINIGINLMFANIASNLIIGIVRLGVEIKWSIEIFGKLSLSISIANLLLNFINAISLVLFPTLRTMSRNQLEEIYYKLRTVLMVAVLGMLILYCPIKNILQVWLPQYQDSLIYLGILFPICVFECKTSLITNTFLKTIRQEKIILWVNVLSVLVSLLLTILFIFILHRFTMAVVSIVIVIMFKSILSEFYLSKLLKVSVFRDILLEVVLVWIFIISNLLLDDIYSVSLYLVCYFFYLFSQRKAIREVYLLKIFKFKEKEAI